MTLIILYTIFKWNNYQKDFEYVVDIAFEDACDAVVGLVEDLMDI